MSDNIMEHDLLLGGSWQGGRRTEAILMTTTRSDSESSLALSAWNGYLFHDRMRSCEGEVSIQCAVESYS
jgi:hypothetical protein